MLMKREDTSAPLVAGQLKRDHGEAVPSVTCLMSQLPRKPAFSL